MLAAIALCFTSYISPKELFTAGKVSENSSYHIHTDEELCLVLNGKSSFKNEVKLRKDGLQYSLRLQFSGMDGDHLFGFLVSEKNNANKITQGSYSISEKVNSFLNDFEGVFGYANMDVLGEYPLFAKEGTLTIWKVDSHRICGTVSVVFESNEGKKIRLKGNFISLRDE